MKIVYLGIVCVCSVALVSASQINEYLSLGDNSTWSVEFSGDGSMVLSYGSGGSDSIYAPAGSFDLMKIDAAIGPFVRDNPTPQLNIYGYSSLHKSADSRSAYYPKDLERAKTVVSEAFKKTQIRIGSIERFEKLLEDYPPFGLHLYFEEEQLLREGYSGPPIHVKKPPKTNVFPVSLTVNKWWAVTTKKYPIIGEASSVALMLLYTPWPYLAVIIILALRIRRIRLNRSVF